MTKMTCFALRASLAISILLFLASAVFADDKRPVHASLEAGQVVVLIINGTEDQESEQYADWAFYLNDFSASHREDYRFLAVDTATMTSLIHDSERFVAPYSLIFMKNGRPSLFHEGPILEPQAYEYVELFYAQQAIPAHLHQFAPVKTDIRLKGCQ